MSAPSGTSSDTTIYAAHRSTIGIYVVGGNLLLVNETVANNSTDDNGGGLYLGGGTVRVSGGSIQNNTAATSGGGIYNAVGKLTLTGDVHVNDNGATQTGGGLYLALNSSTTFQNCLVSGNQTNGDQATTGWGVYWQIGANVDTEGLTDDDDPGGQPHQGS